MGAMNAQSATSKAEVMRKVIVNKVNPSNRNYDFITTVFKRLEQLETVGK